MKILVTGSAGFVAGYLVDELLKHGHQVVGMFADLLLCYMFQKITHKENRNRFSVKKIRQIINTSYDSLNFRQRILLHIRIDIYRHLITLAANIIDKFNASLLLVLNNHKKYSSITDNPVLQNTPERKFEILDAWGVCTELYYCESVKIATLGNLAQKSCRFI